jgi:hypothetical protein
MYDWTLAAIASNHLSNLSDINQLCMDFSKKIVYLERPLVLVPASERQRKQLRVGLCSKLVPLFATEFKDLVLSLIKSSSICSKWLKDSDEVDMDRGDQPMLQLEYLTSIMNHTESFKTREIVERDLVHLLQTAIQKKIMSQTGFEDSTLDKYLFYLESRVTPIVQAVFRRDSSTSHPR